MERKLTGQSNKSNSSSNKNVKFSREVHGDRGTCGTTEVKS